MYKKDNMFYVKNDENNDLVWKNKDNSAHVPGRATGAAYGVYSCA